MQTRRCHRQRGRPATTVLCNFFCQTGQISYDDKSGGGFFIPRENRGVKMKYKQYKNEETRSSVLRDILNPENQAGWARFFDMYSGFVFGTAIAAGLKDNEADEIVQSVMLAIVRNDNIAHYDPSKGPFRAWLAQLVKWRIADFKRKEQAQSKIQLLAPSQLEGLEAPPQPGKSGLLPDIEWIAAVTTETLKRLNADVAPGHFKIYHAATIEGLATESIMNLFHVSRDNIYQIKRRVNLRFKEIFAQVIREMDNPRLPRQP